MLGEFVTNLTSVSTVHFDTTWPNHSLLKHLQNNKLKLYLAQAIFKYIFASKASTFSAVTVGVAIFWFLYLVFETNIDGLYDLLRKCIDCSTDLFDLGEIVQVL